MSIARRGFVAAGAWLLCASAILLGQGTQPVVAIHDSELTRALETIPASPPTFSGAGSTGYEWFLTNWHYFVMPESVQEALRSDGTPFTVLGDSNIAGGLVLSNGLPRYPILFSLASEAIANEEIAPLTNYVASGGFLFVGSSAFTRNTNGTTRGDFAIGNQMGLHMVAPSLTNWTANNFFTRQADHRLVGQIPGGQLTWRMPLAAEELAWGTSPAHPFLAPHFLWRVQAAGAQVLAQGDTYPYLVVRQYGKGWFIYHGGFQPLIGHSGFAPSMYAYLIFRRAIEWAFESQNMPLPRLSPWPYRYDAALIFRHDLENFTNEVANIEASAQIEFTNGATGDYYFCTGTLRDDAASAFNTNAIIAGLRRAVTNYGANIGPHNGGLKNPNNLSLARGQYDYWHWGPDEALDVTPTNYPSGKAYALASVSNSFIDVEFWLAGITNGARIWTGCYFNATREDSLDIEAQLGVTIAGDQKLTPFPHWTLSTRSSGLRYATLCEPVSDWFVNGLVAQSLEPWHPPGVHTSQTLHDAVDFYYNLGGLINLYTHTLATGLGAAGPLVADSITYSLNTNLHPRIWSANAVSIYQWWLQRSNAQLNVTFATNGNQSITTCALAGGSSNLTIELTVPGSGSAFGLQVFTNSTLADTSVYRTNGSVIKVRAGSAVTNAEIRYVLGPKAQNDSFIARPGLTFNVAPPGVLGNDMPGLSTNLSAAVLSGPTNGSLNLDANGGFSYTPNSPSVLLDSFSYLAVDELGNSSAAVATIAMTSPGALFADDFTRPIDPGSITPWTAQSGNWTVTGGAMRGGTNTLQSYGSVYITNSWTNYSVQGRFQFPAGAFGGGLGGRVTPATGKHYAAWIYPEGSPGGSNVLKLIKFTSWNTFGYTNTSSVPMQQVALAAVGTNWHTLKLAFQGNQIGVFLDGAQMMSVSDVEAQPYASGSVSLDFWTDLAGYRAFMDDVSVNLLVNDDSYTMNQDTTLSVLAPGVLANDTEVFGTNLSAVLLTGPTNGVLNLSSNGGFDYTPNTNYYGADTFLYQVNDRQAVLGTASVRIRVNAVNHPPVLPAQPNRTVAVLTPLIVTNTATDPDLPTQGLAYILLDPPNGATIDTSGLITWTPTESQAPGSFTLATVVTDNGTPPLSTTNSFSVLVTNTAIGPPLIIQSILLSESGAAITWSAVTGRTYRLEFKDDLLATNWQNAAPDVTATASFATTTNPVATATQRFYRVLLLP